MAIVERLFTRVNVWTVRQKNGRCREVAVSGGSTVDRKTVLLSFDYCFRGVSLQNDGFFTKPSVRDV